MARAEALELENPEYTVPTAWAGAPHPQRQPLPASFTVYRSRTLTHRVRRILKKTVRILLAMMAALGPAPPPPPPPSPQTDEEATRDDSVLEEE